MIKHIGILGGTFDPVHAGHIQCASYVQQQCRLDEVRLMPCHLPPHRATPGVSAEHRAAMVQLAIASAPKLALERLELNKQSPSYTIDSLKLLRQREPDSRFYFIIGMDSLSNFCQWKDWQDILQYAHLLVCQRPGYNSSAGDAPALIQRYGAVELSELTQSDCGKILLLANPLMDISASELRRQLHDGQGRSDALAPAVLNYIQAQQLYQM